MEIQVNSFNERFDNIGEGHLFLFNNKPHIKIKAEGRLGEFNAVRIGEEAFCRFMDYDVVMRVKKITVDI